MKTILHKETTFVCKFPQKWEHNNTSLGGLEPPTFRLTAERANQLRHRDDFCLY